MKKTASTLIKGKEYFQSICDQHCGWTKKTDKDVKVFFDGKVYMGPDENGIEPLFFQNAGRPKKYGKRSEGRKIARDNYLKRNPGKKSEYEKRWRANNPEKAIAISRRAYLKRKEKLRLQKKEKLSEKK